ncbi:MAG: thioredoxin fold domain-containing protein [Thiohalocapsa sp.]
MLDRLFVPALTLLTGLAAFGPATADDGPADRPGAVTGSKTASPPDWFKESFLDIAEDVSEAADSDKHLILFMEMNGCPYCYKMMEENFKGSSYSDFIQKRFDVIALNVRGDREVAIDEETSLTEKALADQLGVRYTPTLLFLNQANEPVARINGYRNVDDFKQVLEYVDAKAYQDQTLAAYLEARKSEGTYSPRPHEQIKEASEISDLSKIQGPLALLFEDASCVACAALHDGHLRVPEVRDALGKFTVVRMDTLSDAFITAPDGSSTTQKQAAHDFGVEYRPTLLLFDEGKEIARIEGMLYRYHFVGLLEYVGEQQYKAHPGGPFDYINSKTAALTAEGKDVAISDE